MQDRLIALLICAVCASCALAPPGESTAIERGRYLVLIGHCNNCHTDGYVAAAGNLPEARWLMGNPVGWRSRKGTTYAHNLRLFVRDLSEESWLQWARNAQSRAPMPWWSVRAMSDDDLKAMYRYIRSLQPLGDPAPAFMPAGEVPPKPYQQLPDMS